MVLSPLLLSAASLAVVCSGQPRPWPEDGAVLPGNAAVMVWHNQSPDSGYGEPALRLDGVDIEAEVTEVVEGEVHVIRVSPVDQPVVGELELWWRVYGGHEEWVLGTYALTDEVRTEPPAHAPVLTELEHHYPDGTISADWEHRATLTLDEGEDLDDGFWELELEDEEGTTWAASQRWATAMVGDVQCSRTMPELPFGPYELRARQVDLAAGAGPWSEWQSTRSASGCSTAPPLSSLWLLLPLLGLRRRAVPISPPLA